MRIRATRSLFRWFGASAAVLSLLGTARRCPAQVRQYNTGRYTNAGSSYHVTGFSNSGSVTNTGAIATTNTFAAIGIAFANTGVYASATGGANPVNDQFTGAGAQELAGTVAPQFYNLSLANLSSTTFTVSNSSGLDVANVLQLNNGKTMTVGATTPPATATDVAGAIRLGATATLGGTPGSQTYIDGFVGKAGGAGFTYPLGATPTGTVGAAGASPVSSPLYSPITLSNPAGAVLRYVAGASAPPSRAALATQGGGLQLTSVSSKEYYPLYAPAGGGLNTSITIPYTNFGPASYVGSPAQLTIAGFNGTQWVNLSAAPATTVGSGTVTITVPAGTNLSTYQALALASTSGPNPLPVELTDFTATKLETNGLLRWNTASELHSDYFEVQVSLPSQSWQTLGQVQAAGTSGAALSYFFVDKNIARYDASLLYYRLRQVDLDGMSRYSPLQTLSPDDLTWGVTAYPNPYVQGFSAQLTSEEVGPVKLTLLDAAGRIVLQREMAGGLGAQVFRLDEARHIPSGTYVLVVQQNAHAATIRVVRY